MFRLLILLVTSLFLFNCAASPKYRSGGDTGKPARSAPKEIPAGEKRPVTPVKIPDEFKNARSLKTINGKASWYGPKFHGRHTANGEVYDMYGNSAAHKELPFNTWIRVTNKKNNRVIVTRINDRGPFIKGRILDLSYGAARDLDMIIDGVVEVRIEVIRWGKKK